MMELSVAIGDNFFLYPRDRNASLQAYLLAEACARVMYSQNSISNAFTVGYMNYLALNYAEQSQKNGLIGAMRTWFTQVLNTQENLNHTQLAQTYYILLVAALYLNKRKDFEVLSEAFSDMMPAALINESIVSIDSPKFWYEKARYLWNEHG